VGTSAGAAYWDIANQHEFDVKAKRKLTDLQMNYNLVLKRINNVAASLTVTATLSTLLILP
jgi:hypothetical protein